TRIDVDVAARTQARDLGRGLRHRVEALGVFVAQLHTTTAHRGVGAERERVARARGLHLHRVVGGEDVDVAAGRQVHVATGGDVGARDVHVAHDGALA